MIAQSLAILRYFGRAAGLYPTDDPVLAAQIDMAIENQTDSFKAIEMTFAGAEAYCVLDKKWTDEDVLAINERIAKADSVGSLAHVSNVYCVIGTE